MGLVVGAAVVALTSTLVLAAWDLFAMARDLSACSNCMVAARALRRARAGGSGRCRGLVGPSMRLVAYRRE